MEERFLTKWEQEQKWKHGTHLKYNVREEKNEMKNCIREKTKENQRKITANMAGKVSNAIRNMYGQRQAKQPKHNQ